MWHNEVFRLIVIDTQDTIQDIFVSPCRLVRKLAESIGTFVEYASLFGDINQGTIELDAVE